MNKTTKGGLAAVSAAALLLGGAGTLASWSDSAFADGGSITSGYLDLTAGTCDDTWKHTNGPEVGAAVVTVVPGDVITKSCTFTIDAEGDNLAASPSVPSTVTFAATGNTKESLSLPVAATYVLDGAPFTGSSVITDANKADTLTATITVGFPYGTAEDVTGAVNDNDTQRLLVELDDLVVSLTQVNQGA